MYTGFTFAISRQKQQAVMPLKQAPLSDTSLMSATSVKLVAVTCN